MSSFQVVGLERFHTQVFSFQGVGVERFHCIHRCPYFRELGYTVYRGILTSGGLE